MNDFTAYLLVALLSGLAMPLFSAAEMTLIQEKVEQAMMGRVFSLIHLSVSIIMPLGMLLFGPLADVVSVQLLLVISGVCQLALAVPIFSKRALNMDRKQSVEQTSSTNID
jgi:DHA3 family macrolide efflux protein-like MFS transporter